MCFNKVQTVKVLKYTSYGWYSCYIWNVNLTSVSHKGFRFVNIIHPASGNLTEITQISTCAHLA